MKEKGILLPIFSLPSKYGIGDFGYEAYEFIDILEKNKITYWEILPINACNKLPYSPISYYALNEDYISIDKLKEIGLITRIDKMDKSEMLYIDYKSKYYKRAFKKFNNKDREYKAFIKTKEIRQYAEYMSKIEDESKEYYLFLQYMLYKQWIELRKYANQRGIKIIGDMPAYPAFKSAETKYNSKCFEMKNDMFTFEAGAPPDYYNKDGQKWNCPVYNVSHMKKYYYSYLTRRFEYYLKLFDKIRVDYFRGYDSFYKIPKGEEATKGYYSDGVSYDFFDILFSNTNVKKEDLMVEDLGDIREETVKLRNYYQFTRQKILQYSIDLKKLFDKDNEDENVLMFPGNHDCHTIYGWYKNLDYENKERLKEFLANNGCNNININIGIMQYCLKCKAKICIIQAQDILGLDDSSRINTPGTESEKNWSWRLQDFKEFEERIKFFNL